jgi:hypothetical protein
MGVRRREHTVRGEARVGEAEELHMRSQLLGFSVLALSAVLAAQTNIPGGTVIPIALSTSLDAKSSKPGQTVTAKVAQDVPLYNGTTIKAGSRVLGEVLAVSPAANSQPATIALRFSQIDFAGQRKPILTNLRALASPLAVNSAQEATSGWSRGSDPPWSQTTTQIGGDVVYRGGGPVARGVETVGTPVYGGAWGVLSQVASSPGTDCRGAIEGNDRPQALWVFSHDACGVYGYDAVIAHAGRANPEGRIVIRSTDGDLKLRSGSGMLLRVNSADARIVQR